MESGSNGADEKPQTCVGKRKRDIKKDDGAVKQPDRKRSREDITFQNSPTKKPPSDDSDGEPRAKFPKQKSKYFSDEKKGYSNKKVRDKEVNDDEEEEEDTEVEEDDYDEGFVRKSSLSSLEEMAKKHRETQELKNLKELRRTQYTNAIRFYQREQYDDYLEWIIQAATNEHPEAQFLLANIHCQSNMLGLRDFRKAFDLYKEAAKSGHLKAHYEVALFYLGADGLFQKSKENENEAIKWLKRLKKLEEERAKQTRQKTEIHRGAHGLLREFEWEKLLNEYRVADQKGNLNVQYSLGYWCELQDDMNAAIEFYKKSAIIKQCKAIEKLASIHRFGIGVPKNLEESFKWYKEAIILKSKWSREIFKGIGIYLVPDYTASGAKGGDKWYKGPAKNGWAWAPNLFTQDGSGQYTIIGEEEAFDLFKKAIKICDEGMVSGNERVAGVAG